jgi:hypothetical protein
MKPKTAQAKGYNTGSGYSSYEKIIQNKKLLNNFTKVVKFKFIHQYIEQFSYDLTHLTVLSYSITHLLRYSVTQLFNYSLLIAFTGLAVAALTA